MKAYLGQWVIDTAHGHIGKVYQKYRNAEEANIKEFWLSLQSVQYTAHDLTLPWYSVLVQDGGSIAVAESRIAVLHLKEKLNNPYATFYFGEE